MADENPKKERGKKDLPWVGKPAIAIAGLVVVCLVWLLWPNGSGVNSGDIASFDVRRGPLTIKVLEGGNIHALNSHEFRSEIKTSGSSSLAAGTKVLKIIEEGYLVTEEDVKNGKILVELDASRIKERIFGHEVEFQSDLAQYAEADENRAIQSSSNQSDIEAARQIVRFALLDFEKYLGSKAAWGLLKSRLLPFDVDSLAAYEEALDLKEDEDDDAGIVVEVSDSIADSAAGVDFLVYIANDELGDGEAQQKLRELQDNTLVARNELALAEETYQGSIRLAEKDFITQSALEQELVALEKDRLSVKKAETDLELFKRYEFSKAAEEYLSDYEESIQKLMRIKRAAKAKMAQAEARYRTAERRYQLELKEKDELEYMLERCVIRAEVPGLVAYGGAETNYYKSRYYDAISEGADVRYGQPIITIPDMSQMAVSVNIHESYIKKVAIGQKVLISVEAEPGVVLEGSVVELAVLPDSANMRYNPNLKVYPASIHIDGTHDWLKPGMTAKVEVIVNEIEDTLYVPVQSIFVNNDKHFCFVTERGSAVKRTVEVGQFNDEFIEVRDGLTEGETVLLSRPPGIDDEEEEEKEAPKPAVKTLAGAG